MGSGAGTEAVLAESRQAVRLRQVKKQTHNTRASEVGMGAAPKWIFAVPLHANHSTFKCVAQRKYRTAKLRRHKEKYMPTIPPLVRNTAAAAMRNFRCEIKLDIAT